MNHRRYRFLATAMFAALAALTLAPPRAAADDDTTDPAAWAPADSVLFMGIDDVTKLIAQVKQSSFYKLMHDPDLKDLPGQTSLPQKFTQEFRKQVAGALDIQPDKLRNPFAGPVALFASRPRDEDAGTDVTVALVAGVGDHKLAAEYYEKATRKFRSIADNHEKVSFRSHTIDVFTTENHSDEADDGESDDQDNSPPDATSPEDNFKQMTDEAFSKIFSADAMPEKLALCLTDDRLIVASAPETIKNVLRRKPGSGATLLETDNYKTLLHKFKPVGAVRFVLNLSSFFDMMEADDGHKAKETIDMLGLRSMRAVIGHLDYGGKEYESRFEAELLISGPRTGLAKILSMKNTPLAPPKTVASDTFMYWRVNLDILALLDEIERIVRQNDADAADQMHRTLESVPFGEGQTLNLRKEVFAALDPPMILALGFAQPYNPDCPRFLFSLGVKDKDALTRFLGRLTEVAAGMLIERESRGQLVYDASFGGMSVTVGDDALLIGTTPAVDRAMQPGAKRETLAALPDYRRLAALAPPDAWCVVYVDSRRMYEGALELARHKDALMAAQFSNPAAMMTSQFVESLTQGIKPEDIDRARALLKYQASAILTIRTTPDGLHLVNIQLHPAAGD